MAIQIPLLVRLLLHKAPHLIGFGFEPGQHHCGGTCGELDMEVIGTRSKALDHKVQEPRETDAHSPTDPTQRDAFPQQMFHSGAPLIRNEAVVGCGTKLVCARFALMILLPMAGMAIFLVPA
jgi:hypothetical protein